jgi:uncharacterized integral membrane protein
MWRAKLTNGNWDMALTKCRECNESVSTQAAACPHCGAPTKPPVPPLLPVQPPEERLYFDNVVAVTTTRVIIGGTTYALRNITSVKMMYTPPQIGWPLSLLVFGLFFLGLSVLFPGSDGTPIIAYIFLGAWIAGAILWMVMTKTRFHVNLSSASGEVHALTSKNKAYIERVVLSINKAIVKHK